jgi:hypothetical protein
LFKINYIKAVTQSIFVILLLSLGSFVSRAQTVIEMCHPGDANILLLEVGNIANADIVIYKTRKLKEADEWNCKWKFKKWGFSNFTVYITSNPDDSLMIRNESGIKYHFNGRVYFTSKPEERGYKTPGFVLDGIFRKIKSGDSYDREYVRSLKNKVW